MKKTVLATVILLTLSTGGMAQGFEATAQVVSSQPIYQAVTTQNCHTETITTQPAQQAQGYGGSIIGGIAGALLGSQVGGGTGRIVAGAAGAIAGSMVGNHLENNQAQPATYTQQVCTPVTSQQIVGYGVTYSIGGQQGSVNMTHQPGATMPVNIDPVVN